MRRSTLALALVAGVLNGPGLSSADEPADAFAAAAADYGAQRWKLASEGFASLLAERPDHPRAEQARFFLGEALAQAGRHAEARRQFAELLRKSPDSRYARQAQFRGAEAAYLSGDTPTARSELEAFVNRFADDELCGYALAHLGNLELRCGNATAARKWFSTALDHFQDGSMSDQCRLGLAEAAYALGDLQEAAGAFAALTAGGKSDDLVARGHSGLGWCRFKAADWSGAAEAFGRLLHDCPQSPLADEAILMRASSLEHLDKLDEALAQYEDALKREVKGPRAAEALWGAARMHDHLKHSPQAVELYARLVREHADFAQLDTALYRWAWLAREGGQTAEANETWGRLRRDFPNSPLAADATLRVAEAALADERLDQADTLLADITDSKTPEGVRQHALFLRARVAMAARRWPEAERALADMIAQFPEGELALSAAYWMAEASYRQEHYDIAAQRLAELATKSGASDQPWAATAELRRAQALAQLKEWDESLSVAQAIETHWPQFAEQHEVDYLIGRALVAKAEFDPARQAYRKVIESPRGSGTQTAAMARFMIGESYFHQENYTAALAEYEKVCRDDAFPRWQAAAFLQAGKCHQALGQWESAAEAFDKSSATDAESPLAAEARRRAAAAREQARTKSPKLK